MKCHFYSFNIIKINQFYIHSIRSFLKCRGLFAGRAVSLSNTKYGSLGHISYVFIKLLNPIIRWIIKCIIQYLILKFLFIWNIRSKVGCRVYSNIFVTAKSECVIKTGPSFLLLRIFVIMSSNTTNILRFFLWVVFINIFYRNHWGHQWKLLDLFIVLSLFSYVLFILSLKNLIISPSNSSFINEVAN